MKPTVNTRVKFSKGKQRKFLKGVLVALDMNQAELANMSKVCNRTLRDWIKEKYTLQFRSLKSMCKRADIGLPKDIRILPQYWSLRKACRLGGKRYIELYGSPGTVASRRLGGVHTQEKLRNNPDYFRKLGLITRKKIKYPHKSSQLAEFIGILLGDGNIRSNYQIAISFNGEKDRSYALYIKKLIKKLFGIFSTLRLRKEKNRADIVASGRNLVEFLQKSGIKKGNKVFNQINVPDWIFRNKKYQAACVRGLFDTDGCVYQHNYTVGSKRYSYIKMCFRNYSIPILLSLKAMLKNLGFTAVLDKKHKAVYINRRSEVSEYFIKVGTGNPRYFSRYNKFFKER